MSIQVEAGRQPPPSSSDLLSVIPAHVGPRLLTSWGGVVHSVRPPGEMSFQSPGDFIAVVLAPVPRPESRVGSDRMLSYDAPVGTLFINPANVDSASRWASLRENITVGFEPGRLAALAEQEFGIAQLELRPPPFGHVDEQALQIAQLLRQELLGEAPNALYADSLITVLGIHAIRRYSSAEGKAILIKPVGGLSPAAAKRVQEFLNHNVANKVTIAGLAEVCDLSPSHFIEAFSKTFGTPPYQYLLNLRLALAVELLTQTAMPIVEIAHLSGFSSQSHLTSTMRKYRQTTPAQVRLSGRS